MRQSPSFTSKIVSQAICAERIDIQEIEDGWVYCETSDGYRGWVVSESIAAREHPYCPTISISRLRAHVYSRPDLEYGPLMTLPFGVLVHRISQNERWTSIELPDGTRAYIQNGDVEPESKLQNKKELATFSLRFLGLPYTWGGRSSFGFDCSGFVQMLYQKIGIRLQRDANQQILDERLKLVSMSQLESGDLIFFGESATAISHVALALDHATFIHATAKGNRPWCRISDFNEPLYPFWTARQLRI